MSEELSTATALENEIMKAVDVTYGFDQGMRNVATALRVVLSGSDKNILVGGKVMPYRSGGMNVSIAPIFASNGGDGNFALETGDTGPVPIEEASPTYDRIDIIQVKGVEEGYDSQTRKFNDPTTGTKSTRTIDTKKRVVIRAEAKTGVKGSTSAPYADEGYVKIAEVHIPAGTTNITEDMIRNVTASQPGEENQDWASEKAVTFSPGTLSAATSAFLVAHNAAGNHKSRCIKASNISFGTENDGVKASMIPSGGSVNVHGSRLDPETSVLSVLMELAENVSNLYPYSNGLFSRYSVADVKISAVSTEDIDVATGGEITVDSIPVTAGQVVLLAGQEDPVQNGLWEVQTGAWNRAEGYTAAEPSALNHKLLHTAAGRTNKGKIFFLPDDEYVIGEDALDFEESGFAISGTPNKIVIRDEKGRAQVEPPENDNDIATKGYTDKAISRGGGGGGLVSDSPRFLVFDFSAPNKKTLKVKAGTHIRLDITDTTGSSSRTFDADEDRSFDLSEKIAAAAAASSTRIGATHGRDFYVYLAPDDEDGVDLVVSTNATWPNDIDPSYTANNTRKIGQFHTLCADAGASLTGQVAAAPSSETAGGTYLVKQYKEDEDGFYGFYRKSILSVASGTYYDVLTVEHPLAGFLAGDILPESVWCLAFRPFSGAEGMVYDVDTDMGGDVYLQSGRGRLTASCFGGTITDTRPHPCHQDDMRQVRKRLLRDHEFASMALGSNECTNINGSADPNTTGGHVDTTGRRMLSFIGLEDCCGAMWQWLEDVSALGTGTAWTNISGTSANVGNTGWITCDGQNRMGQHYNASTALLAGGDWDIAACCGSRSRHADDARSFAYTSFGGRGASRVLRKA